MLKIGDFSKLTRISIRMLRHYDEIGLLKPDRIDNFTSYRYYSAAKLPIANRITALKDMGFSLAVITEIMSQYHDSDQLKKLLQIKLAEVKDQAEQTKTKLNLLETTILRLGKDDIVMKIGVVLKEMPKKYVASLREIIPNYNAEGILWGKMMQEIAPQNVGYANPCYSTAVFHDKEYKESDVDVEVQISVSGEYHDTANVKFKTIEPIQVASVIIKGSYDQLTEVNENVCRWIEDNKYELDGNMFNIYHVSPSDDTNPENWVTEICYPVKKITKEYDFGEDVGLEKI